MFVGGGWSQWRADVSVAGAARGLRACVRNGPGATPGFKKKNKPSFFKSFSASECVR